MSEQRDEKAFEELLRLMKERHAREVSKPRSQFKLPSFLHWFALETQAYNRQQKCSHLKGQIGAGPRGPVRDYNIAMHTFPNGETKIWCLSNCGWNVWNRPGWSFKWVVGMRMVDNSSNKASASQIATKTNNWIRGMK